ncbi:MAG: energy-coupling factor ABC transporter permease [Halanaerobiales bacterium]|nr:energy-coupling factor ABC transporter permease [Halanaerobiales bacterium]
MSHIHIPDGVLPISWWVIGYLITAVILVVAIRKVENEDIRKSIPFLGVISALMLITMSIPVGGLPIHINLTILAGILAGPWLGFIAVFIVNTFLSFMGHGGITVVGLNCLVLGLEIFVGWGVFNILKKKVYLKDILSAGIAVMVALLISTSFMVVIVGASQIGWEFALPHNHGDENHETHDLEVVQTESNLNTYLEEVSILGISGLVGLMAIILIGIFMEVIVTIFIVRFFSKVRPDLLKR